MNVKSKTHELIQLWTVSTIEVFDILPTVNAIKSYMLRFCIGMPINSIKSKLGFSIFRCTKVARLLNSDDAHIASNTYWFRANQKRSYSSSIFETWWILTTSLRPVFEACLDFSVLNKIFSKNHNKKKSFSTFGSSGSVEFSIWKTRMILGVL